MTRLFERFMEAEDKFGGIPTATCRGERWLLYAMASHGQNILPQCTAMEVGTAWGRSAATVAHARAILTQEPLWCVDIWEKYIDWNGTPAHIEIDDCIKRMREAGVRENLAFIKTPSTQVASIWYREFNYLFIDGCHDPEMILHDVKEFGRRAHFQAPILCHDYALNKEMKEAIDKGGEAVGRKVTNFNNLALLFFPGAGLKDIWETNVEIWRKEGKGE